MLRRIGSTVQNLTNDAKILGYISIHYCRNLNRGGQNGLIEMGKATASVQRSQLIVVLTKAVGQPSQLID